MTLSNNNILLLSNLLLSKIVHIRMARGLHSEAELIAETQVGYCKWPYRRPLPNKRILSNKRPLNADKIDLDAPL